MTQTRQKHAFSDHSDLVARRMGFIPFPLGVVLIKALYTAISVDNVSAILLIIVAYLTLVTCRVLNTICALGKACDLMQAHQKERHVNAMSPSSHTSTAPATTITTTSTSTIPNIHSSTPNQSGFGLLPETPIKPRHSSNNTTSDMATSPVHSFNHLQRSFTADAVPEKKSPHDNSSLLGDPNLGATALFSNSDVDLDDVCLNEKVLNMSSDDLFEEQVLTRSVPDLQQECEDSINKSEQVLTKRTHKRSESEPSFQPHNE